MLTSSARTSVPAEPAEVFAAVRSLVGEVWSVTDADVVEARPPHRLVHAVRLDDDIACWLTWDLNAAAAGTTEVRLVHDELDTRAVPDPQLDEVLAVLRATVTTSRTREEQS